MAHEGKRPQKVTQVVVCCCSEHHDVFTGCQCQRCPHYRLGQGTGATPTLGNVLYCLQHVQLVAYQLTVFAALLKTMKSSNTKLGESVKHLF